MADHEGPVTWDSDGRLVPLTEAELQRQAVSVLPRASTTTADCEPRLLTADERRYYRWRGLVDVSRNFLQFRWFDEAAIGDVRLIPVAICLAILTLPLFSIALVSSLTALFVGEAQMRRIRRRLLDQDASRSGDYRYSFGARITDKLDRNP